MKRRIAVLVSIRGAVGADDLGVRPDVSVGKRERAAEDAFRGRQSASPGKQASVSFSCVLPTSTVSTGLRWRGMSSEATMVRKLALRWPAAPVFADAAKLGKFALCLGEHMAETASARSGNVRAPRRTEPRTNGKRSWPLPGMGSGSAAFARLVGRHGTCTQ